MLYCVNGQTHTSARIATYAATRDARLANHWLMIIASMKSNESLTIGETGITIYAKDEENSGYTDEDRYYDEMCATRTLEGFYYEDN